MSSTAFLLEDQQRALLAQVAEVEAEEARVFARKMALRARMDELWNPPVPSAREQFGVLELAGTARIGQTRAGSQLLNGTKLLGDLPGTYAALQAGVMYRETAVLLLELTRNCTAEVVRELERRLLPSILTANTTDVRRLVLAMIPEVEADLDPELTEQRLKQARDRRSVYATDRGEGITAVICEMDVLSGRRFLQDFEELVRAQKVADDRAGVVRTADQRRADVLAQLPSRFLALLQAVRKGQTEQLLALALADPDLADDLEALAATLPPDLPEAQEQTAPRCEPAEEAVGPEAFGFLEPLDAVVPSELAELLPLPPEPPPDEAREPDPPDRIAHWTELSLLELAAGVLGLPVRNPVLLNVHVPMSTLLELDNRTGRIDQGGALPASMARLLLPDAALRRVLVDPDSGVPIGIDPTITPAPGPGPAPGQARPAHKAAPAAIRPGRERLEDLLAPFVLHEHAEPQHDPSRRLRELIDLRDQRCTGIGCSQPASRCHHDHEDPYPHGPTAAWNLSAKSARCHRAKHTGWTVTRHGPGPQHGQTTWTSPLGHSYTRPSAWFHPGTRPRLQLFAPRPDVIIEIDLPTHGHAA